VTCGIGHDSGFDRLISSTFFVALLLVITFFDIGARQSLADEQTVSGNSSTGQESVSPKAHKLDRSPQAARKQPQPPDHPPAETVWNEYVNSEYHYKIRYPSTSKLDKSDPSHVIIELVEPFDVAVEPFDGSSGRNVGQDVLTFEIAVYKNPKGFSFD
jgi:hypothetical protein